MNVVAMALPMPWRKYFDALEEALLQTIPRVKVYSTQFFGLVEGADTVITMASVAPGIAGPLVDIVTAEADLRGLEITAVHHCAWVRKTVSSSNAMLLSITGLAEDRSYRVVFRDSGGKDVTAEVAAEYEADTGTPWDKSIRNTGDTFWDLVAKRRAG